MIQEEIIEGNKLIMNFMGFKSELFENSGGVGYHVELNGVPTSGGGYSCAKYGTLQDNIGVLLLWAAHYHTSWDWLMPVVENIESIGDTMVSITKNTCCIMPVTTIGDRHVHDSIVECKDSKIEAAYCAVVAFIEWYNKQPK